MTGVGRSETASAGIDGATAPDPSSDPSGQAPAAAGQGPHESWPLRARALAGVDVRAAALLLSDQSGGNLALEVGAVALGGEEEAAGVLLVVEVDGGDLLAESTVEQLSAELLLYVVGPDQELVMFSGRAVSWDSARWRAPLLAAGLKFAVPLALRSGEYTVRLLVRRSDGERFALRTLPVSVAPAEAGPSPATLAFPDPVGAWADVGDPSSVGLGLPAGPGGRAWRPALRPVLPAAAPGDLFLLGPGPRDDPDLTIRFVGPDGGLGEEVTVTARGARAQGGGPGLWAATLPSLDLEPGPYTVHVGHPSVGTLAREVLVVAESADPPLVWASLDPMLLQPAAEPLPGHEEPPFHALAVRRGYREVLRLLAEGRFELAHQRLRTLETETIGAGAGEVVDRLAGVQLRVVRGLVRPEPDALAAVLYLHHQAYFNAVTEGAPIRAAHSRLLIGRLVALCRGAGPARSAAADVLASVARDMQAGGAGSSADHLYEQALGADRSNPLALMGMAVSRERAGNYHDAAHLLERRLAVEPPSPEARLRLGINLARLGNRRQAGRQLEACFTAGPAWVRVVALQERARLLADMRQPEPAITLLERSLARFPGEESLVLLLARLHDRFGDRARALELVERLQPEPGDPYGSPRWRYSQWPEEDWRAAKDRLERTAREGLPALVRALPEEAP